jgi:serine protease inhibitor
MNHTQNNQNKYRSESDKVFENNTMTFDNMKHGVNVGRLIMERGQHFGGNHDGNGGNHDGNGGNHGSNDDNGDNVMISNHIFGEITGTNFNPSNMDQGMPLRGFLDKDKNYIPSIEEQQQKYNPQLDVDLYDPSAKPRNDVSYFDPHSNGSHIGDNFSSVNENIKLLNEGDKLSPILKMSETINNFSCNVVSKFNKLLKNNKTLTISPLAILAPLMLLYRSSSSKTEYELQSVLGLEGNKDVATKSFSSILGNAFSSNSANASSLIFIPDHVPINKAFINFVNELGGLGSVIPFNPKNINNEYIKINNVISSNTNNNVKNMIHPSNLSKYTNTMLISTTVFSNELKNPFNVKNTKHRAFFSNNSRKPIPMMYQTNEVFNYYQDEYNQVIEMDFIDNQFTLGIMLPSDGNKLEFSYDFLNYYWSNLRPTQINNLIIPRIINQSKYKIDSFFKKLGLREIFNQADFSELTPPGNLIRISDIIHQSIINISETKSEQTNNSGQNKNSSKINFIANRPFIYYVKDIKTNAIVINGYYY